METLTAIAPRRFASVHGGVLLCISRAVAVSAAIRTVHFVRHESFWNRPLVRKPESSKPTESSLLSEQVKKQIDDATTKAAVWLRWRNEASMKAAERPAVPTASPVPTSDSMWKRLYGGLWPKEEPTKVPAVWTEYKPLSTDAKSKLASSWSSIASLPGRTTAQIPRTISDASSRVSAGVNAASTSVSKSVTSRVDAMRNVQLNPAPLVQKTVTRYLRWSAAFFLLVVFVYAAGSATPGAIAKYATRINTAAHHAPAGSKGRAAAAEPKEE